MTPETICIIVALVAVVALATWALIRDRKRGGSCSCGCSCSSCPMSGKCHPSEDKTPQA